MARRASSWRNATAPAGRSARPRPGTRRGGRRPRRPARPGATARPGRARRPPRRRAGARPPTGRPRGPGRRRAHSRDPLAAGGERLHDEERVAAGARGAARRVDAVGAASCATASGDSGSIRAARGRGTTKRASRKRPPRPASSSGGPRGSSSRRSHRRRSPSSPRPTAPMRRSSTGAPAATRSSSWRALAAGGERLPDTVRDAVLARAARLSQPALTLLEAVAISPARVEPWLLEALAGELGRPARRGLASGMLAAGRRTSRSGTSSRGRRSRRRRADRRLALHRAALAALPAASADPTCAPRPSRGRGRRRRGGAALGAARRRARRLLRRAPGGGRPVRPRAAVRRRSRAARRADLLSARADECYTAAELEAAIMPSAGARLPPQAGRPARRGRRAARAVAAAVLRAGAPDEAEPLALEAVALLEALPPGHELAMAYGNVAQRRRSSRTSRRRWRGGTRQALADASTTRRRASTRSPASAGRSSRRIARRASPARAGAGARPEHGLEEYAGRAFSALVMCRLRLRRFDLAVRPLDAGLAYCAERGLETWRLYLVALRSTPGRSLIHSDTLTCCQDRASSSIFFHSSALSCSFSAAMFSSRCASDDVPGIGNMTGDLAATTQARVARR